MKKRCLFLATLFVVAAVSVAMVSCKKETQNAPLKPTESLQAFNPLEIEDMNAYLKGFKQKMLLAQKGDNEALSLEDAAWHISSLANYEFANVNVESNDVRFDTLYAHVNITNGVVLLSDLAATYQTVSSSIDKFYNSLALDNKHFRFINAFISENGEVTIPLLTTFTHSSKDLPNHLWYFDDEWLLADICDSIFPASTYPVQTTGTSALLYELTQKYYQPINTTGPVYYTLASSILFDPEHNTDPYGSPYNNSRLFLSYNTTNCDLGLDICYLYDSYLGLGYDNCPSGQVIASWELNYYYHLTMIGSKEYHLLKVNYAIQHIDEEEPGNDNNL